MQDGEGRLAHIATISSRPHALVVATLLEHDGIPVRIDGVWHAWVDPRGRNDWHFAPGDD